MSAETQLLFQAILHSETVLKLSSCLQSVPQISIKFAFCVAGYMFLAEDFVELQEE